MKLIATSLILLLSVSKSFAWTPEEMPHLDEYRTKQIEVQEQKMIKSKACLAKNIAEKMDGQSVLSVQVAKIKKSYFFEKPFNDGADYKITFYLAHNIGNDILVCSINTAQSDADNIYNCINGKDKYTFSYKLRNSPKAKSFAINKGCLN